MNPRTAGLFGVAGPLIIFVFVSVSILNSPWFSFAGNWLSDLGVNETSALIFNSGLVIGGLLILLFSLEFRKKNLAGYLLIPCSIFLIGLGIFTSAFKPVHANLSALFFFSVLFLMMASVLFSQGKARYISLLSVIISLVLGYSLLIGAEDAGLKDTAASLIGQERMNIIAKYMPLINLGKGAISESIVFLLFGIFLIVSGYGMMKEEETV